MPSLGVLDKPENELSTNKMKEHVGIIRNALWKGLDIHTQVCHHTQRAGARTNKFVFTGLDDDKQPHRSIPTGISHFGGMGAAFKHLQISNSLKP